MAFAISFIIFSVLIAVIAYRLPSATRAQACLRLAIIAFLGLFLAKYTFDLALYQPGRIDPRLFYTPLKSDSGGSRKTKGISLPKIDSDRFIARTIERFGGDREDRLINDIDEGYEEVQILAAEQLAKLPLDDRALLAFFAASFSPSKDLRKIAGRALAGENPDAVLERLGRLVREQGNGEELYFAGRYFGSHQRYVDALGFFQAAAEQGYSAAHYDLGSYYAEGRDGIAVDHEQALAHLAPLASAGDIPAQFYLVKLYIDGVGDQPAVDIDVLQQRFRKQQNPEWGYLLGMMYYRGIATETDYGQALSYLKKASNQGVRPATMAYLALLDEPPEKFPAELRKKIADLQADGTPGNMRKLLRLRMNE